MVALCERRGTPFVTPEFVCLLLAPTITDGLQCYVETDFVSILEAVRNGLSRIVTLTFTPLIECVSTPAVSALPEKRTMRSGFIASLGSRALRSIAIQTSKGD